MRRALALALLLAGCAKPAAPAASDSPGARLEAAAVSAGLVADPAGSIAGSWARGTDRLCVMGSGATATRVGALVDYGEGQSCAASGTLRRSGSRLDMVFGDCRIRAIFDGERIVLPPEVPPECDAVCGGRASLAAMAVDRVSASLAEAATLHDGAGRALCGG
ncbi:MULTISPECIES: hypothetical protein [unclassified Sphingomonas]|uniref:hypothetical protein n=1 Tax=unclassified Sphingomonas TaxID=196159 RepID=UPI002269FBEA|nr:MULTISPECIES: hypothetical protein [unclassified Sphingomonas]